MVTEVCAHNIGEIVRNPPRLNPSAQTRPAPRLQLPLPEMP